MNALKRPERFPLMNVADADIYLCHINEGTQERSEICKMV